MTLNLVQRNKVCSTFEATALDQLFADLLVVHDDVSDEIMKSNDQDFARALFVDFFSLSNDDQR